MSYKYNHNSFIGFYILSNLVLGHKWLGFHKVLKLYFEMKLHVYAWFECQYGSLVSCISRALGLINVTLYHHVNKHDYLPRVIWGKSSIDSFYEDT